MLTLMVVAQLVIVNASPPIPAADALGILARLDSPSNWTNRFVCSDCDGPRVTVVPYRAGDGPFGRFPAFQFGPLDRYYQVPIYGRWRTNRYPSSRSRAASSVGTGWAERTLRRGSFSVGARAVRTTGPTGRAPAPVSRPSRIRR